MSRQYKRSKDVPSHVLCKRLDELAQAVTIGKEGVDREFYMRVPAEVDNDADLVLSEASRRIMQLEEKCLSKEVFFDVLEPNTWYWIGHPHEGDIWHPIFINSDLEFKLDGEITAPIKLKDCIIRKAITP